MRKTLVLATALLAGAGGLAATVAWPESAERVADGLKFTEGPAWNAKGFLIFSDIPANRIYRWEEGKELAVFREPSQNSNGLAFDAKGRLVACEHGARRVTRTEADGTTSVLADRFEGKRLNSPNDLTLGPDGSIYFTDPPYGVKPDERELDFQGVFRIAPDGKLSLVVKDLGRPNGLGLSPDGKRLYVDDSERKLVNVYDVQSDGSVANGRLLIDLAQHGTRVCDGLKVDAEGNLYVTGTEGVYVVSPEGKFLARIGCAGQCTNCCFGGADGKLSLVVKDLGRPNGLGFSPDAKRLYVDDSARKLVNVYDVQPDGSVANGRLLIDLAQHGARVCDGLKVDAEGNLYVTGTDGVYVVSPEGKFLARIGCPGQCTNCCFGGADRKTLFVTGRSDKGGSLYRVRVPVGGLVTK